MKAGDIYSERKSEREKEIKDLAKLETAKKTIRSLSALKRGGKKHKRKTLKKRRHH